MGLRSTIMLKKTNHLSYFHNSPRSNERRKAYEICYETHNYDSTHLTLGMLLHYLEKIKI